MHGSRNAECACRLRQAQRARLVHRTLREGRRRRIDRRDELRQPRSGPPRRSRCPRRWCERLRCCTLSSTSSSVCAAPLWKYGAPANALSSDAMLLPSTPLHLGAQFPATRHPSFRWPAPREGARLAQEAIQLRGGHFGDGRRRREVEPARGPVRAAMAALAVGGGKQVASGQHIRVTALTAGTGARMPNACRRR